MSTRRPDWRSVALAAVGVAVLLLAWWSWGVGQVVDELPPMGAPPSVDPAQRMELAEHRAVASPLLADGDVGAAHTAADWAMPRPVVRTHPRLSLQPDGRTLRGRVLDSAGLPVRGAEVLLYSDTFASHGERGVSVHGVAHTDAAGGFVLGASGDFGPRTRAWTERAWVVVRVAGHPPVVARPTVAPGAADVRLPAAERLRGVLVFDDGAPVDGAQLRLDDQVALHRRWTDPRVEASRVLGTSDASGVFDVPVPADWRTLTLTVMHPEHGGSVELRRPTPGDLLQLALPHATSLQVELLGDVAGWSRPALRARLRLQPLFEQGDGRLGPERAWHSGMAPDPSWPVGAEPPRFVRIEHPHHRLLLTWQGGPRRGEVLVERWDARRGARQLALTLPPAPPADDVAGEVADRAFELDLVDMTNAPWPALLPWSGTCDVRLHLVVRSASGSGSWLDERPGGLPRRVALGERTEPFTLALVGPAEPVLARHVQPGDRVTLRLDPAELLDSHGLLALDHSALPADLPLDGLSVRLYGEDFRAEHRDGGLGPHLLPAGRWRVTARGAGLESMNAVVVVEAGRFATVALQPSAPAPAGKAVLRGRLGVRAADPWVCAGPLYVTRLEGEGAPLGDSAIGQPHDPDGFRLELDPGRYELRLFAARVFGPESLRDRGLALEDWDDWPGAELIPETDQRVTVSLEAGEVRELDVLLDGTALRTVVLRLEPGRAAEFEGPVRWRPVGLPGFHDGTMRYCRGWPERGNSFALPPGPWEIQLGEELHRVDVQEGEGPQFVRLDDGTRVHPPRDTEQPATAEIEERR